MARSSADGRGPLLFVQATNFLGPRSTFRNTIFSMILLKNVPLHCLHENNSFNFPKNIYIANKINCRLGRDEKLNPLHLLVKDCFACIKPCISAGLRFLNVMYPSDYCTSRILPVFVFTGIDFPLKPEGYVCLYFWE